MSKLLSFLFVAALCCAQTALPAKKSALDKAVLEAYVRHLFVMDKRIDIKVGDPKPSTDLPGFLEVKVRASMGTQAQDFEFLVSKDGSKILQGTVYDTNQNPFKSENDKLKTDFEPSLGAPGRRRRVGGVLGLPMPVLQGRGEDDPGQPDEDLPVGCAPVFQDLPARIAPPLGQARRRRQPLRLQAAAHRLLDLPRLDLREPDRPSPRRA